jgi:hypothetical protein
MFISTISTNKIVNLPLYVKEPLTSATSLAFIAEKQKNNKTFFEKTMKSQFKFCSHLR